FLGEKLFRTWLAAGEREGRAERAGSLAPLSSPSSSSSPSPQSPQSPPSPLTSWVQRFAWPLSDSIWHNGPDMEALLGKGQAAMDQYIGLILFANEAFPSSL